MATLNCNLLLCANNKKGICKSISGVDISVEWVQSQGEIISPGTAFRLEISNPKFECPICFIKGEAGAKVP